MHHSSSHRNPTPHLDTVHQVGMMLAQAVFHGDNIPIRLAPSLLKQVRESMTMHFYICTVADNLTFVFTIHVP